MLVNLDLKDHTVGNINSRNRFVIRMAAYWLVFQSLFFVVIASLIWAQEEDVNLSSIVRERLELRVSVEDELLHNLEKDFVKLLKRSRNAEALIEAEILLEATNNNSHWTNYSKASKILRRTRDKAAIPLLLRYMVEHSKRSSSHVMIPEYAKTISMISGHQLDNPYKSGPNLEKRMRSKVTEIVNKWWSKEIDKITTEPNNLSDAQLRVIVINLLKEVRRNGDFTGSGGNHDSAYGAYHNVYYKVVSSSSSDRYEISVLHPAMVTMVLEPSGYGSIERSKIESVRRFPYETIPILAELAKSGHRKKIEEITNDKKQNSTVRLACILSLYRADEVLRVNQLLEILKNEKTLENRLINLLALRWGGEKAVSVLLKHMDDPNIEIATAAACALVDAQPDEALPKFKKLLSRDHYQTPTLLLKSLAEYKNRTSHEILADMLEKSLDGHANQQHLNQILYVFIDACGLPRPSELRDAHTTRAQARLAITRYLEQSEEQEALLRELITLVESVRTQFKVAQKIETLRRTEYKRLLSLQGDCIVTAEQSQKASERLKASIAEVKSLKSQLEETEAKRDSLISKVK